MYKKTPAEISHGATQHSNTENSTKQSTNFSQKGTKRMHAYSVPVSLTSRR